MDTRTMPAARAILWGTLAVGVLDGLFAVVTAALNGVGPMRVFQAVAGGLLGREAFRGGWATSALGLALHFLIAFLVVSVYFVASRRFGVQARHPVASGLVYGVVVYFVMHHVVLPMSAIKFPPPTMGRLSVDILGHALFVGLPSALFARKTPS